MRTQLISIILACLVSEELSAQPCTNLGQTPSTAFPVCGNLTFFQNNVPICGSYSMPVNCFDGALYTDKNPYWYKFTCYVTGTLGFIITPNNLNDDYDWQLFNITGQNPNNVFTDTSLIVSYNWSGYHGVTGATSAGTSLFACAGFTPIFSSMPTVVAGQEYLLLVSHFTNSQSGYKLEFTGGSAVLNDPLQPQISSAIANCDGTFMTIHLNKKIRCNTIASNGSDFTIGSAATVISATSPACSAGFDTDSILLALSNSIPGGNYTLTIQAGTDGNTLLDDCNQAIAGGANIPFAVAGALPLQMNSITAAPCKPSSINLLFTGPVLCSSVAGDASDFNISGPQPVTISNVIYNCSGGFADVLQLQLASPITVGGTYTVHLNSGSDGNTVISACGVQTPAGETLSFTVRDSVSAAFTYSIHPGCRMDTVFFFYNGGGSVSNWGWQIDNVASNLQNPIMFFPTSGHHVAKLSVTNGSCSDIAVKDFTLNNEINAAFEAGSILCPEDSARFLNNSSGNILSWSWNFGNGLSSSLQHPRPFLYPLTGNEKFYTVSLIITDSIGCRDTTIQNIRVLGSCYIAVPTAFTPNGDGLNDFLYPLNALKADNLDFKVFNRWGVLLFHSKDWQQKWDGAVKGKKQPIGAYLWLLSYTEHDTGKKVFLKGTTVLIR